MLEAFITLVGEIWLGEIFSFLGSSSPGGLLQRKITWKQLISRLAVVEDVFSVR